MVGSTQGNKPAQKRGRRDSHLLVSLVAAIMSAGIMAIANLTAGRDIARKLAHALQVENSALLSACIGGLVALWLSLGGPKRWAAFSGSLFAVGGGILFWHFGRPYVWVIEVVLRGTFGEGGRPFTGAVGYLLLFLFMRRVAEAARSALKNTFCRWTAADRRGSNVGQEFQQPRR
jgi:hypothetical protein